MKKSLMFLLLTLCAGSLGAAPITFDSSQFQTDALALLGAASGQQLRYQPSRAAALLTTASATSGTDFADSAGSADDGFLTAFAEVGERAFKAHLRVRPSSPATSPCPARCCACW